MAESERARSRYAHDMPFGAQSSAEDTVRFRLWAPAAKRVELVFCDGRHPSTLEMPACDDGWYELITAAARPGTRYRYRIDGALEVPDPASRFNPEDVHGPSVVVDPTAFEWTDGDWRGRPWHEAVIYELHTGTFSPEGSFRGIERRLGHLMELGVTVIELMPIADFPGRFGWGYDGVLPFAPDSAYGTPEELKSLIVAAHRRGLAVMLDVVYNHFGPEGNYLNAYAPQFFSSRHQTPWGPAINFDGPDSRTVRDFFIHNALYWLTEYHLDGLRFDAVHAIRDDGTPDILTELARRIRSGPRRKHPIHLVLENVANQARYLGSPGALETFDAQWNDDEHHCLHVILTGEQDGYYADYAPAPRALLCRCLAEGFAYQGEFSSHEGHRARGEPSKHLPRTAFVAFLQNHDQIGNRAFGDRLGQLARSEAALRAAAAVVLLAPSPPLLFMGEEWGAREPFPYFCDFEPDLAAKVRAGRRHEFARFEKFRDEAEWARVPDPCAEATFESARLCWDVLDEPSHARWLAYYRELLELRRREIIPRVPTLSAARWNPVADLGAVAVDWLFSDGAILHLLANLTEHSVPIRDPPVGRVIFTTHPQGSEVPSAHDELEPWSVDWRLEDVDEQR